MDAGANARAGDDDFPRMGRRGSDSGADSRIAALRNVGRACAALLSRTAHLHPHPHPLLTTTTDCLPVVSLRPSLLFRSLSCCLSTIPSRPPVRILTSAYIRPNRPAIAQTEQHLSYKRSTRLANHVRLHSRHSHVSLSLTMPPSPCLYHFHTRCNHESMLTADLLQLRLLDSLPDLRILQSYSYR